MSNLAHKLPDPPPRDFTWLPGEIEVLRKKEPLPNGAADWAPRHRVISRSSRPGPYRHENSPYFYGLMVLYSRPWLRELTLCAGSQLGKTDGLLYNTHGYDVHYDPGDTLFVMPTRDTTKDVSLDRVDDMYDSCDVLRAMKSRNPDDTSMTRKKLRNGVVSYFGWAGSDAVLASKPIKYVKIDEADLVGRRSMNLARARFRTFRHEYKFIAVSKPSYDDGPIWEDLNASHAIFDFHVACPHCDHDQVMNFAQFRWTEGVTDPRKIEMTGDAWYECGECGKPWSEYDRDEAVKAAMQDGEYGGWKPRQLCACCDIQMVDGRCPKCRGEEAAPIPAEPEHAGAHLPAFYSPYVLFADIVADYLRYLQDPAARENEKTPSNAEKFWCDDCALPIRTSQDGETLSEQTLYDRREWYSPKGARWEIPLAAALLTAFVDVQGNRLEIEVEAWGMKKENWGICHEVLPGNPEKEEVWRDLEERFLERTWRHESGVEMTITALAVDSGYLPDMVYKFVKKWRKRRKVYATKGWAMPGKPIKGKPSMNNSYKIPVYMIGTEAAKDTIFGWLDVAEPGPYYRHFSRAYGYEFFRQLCSEEGKTKKDKRGRSVKVYEIRKGYNRNEGLDLVVGNLAAYEILNPVMERLVENLKAGGTGRRPKVKDSDNESRVTSHESRVPSPESRNSTGERGRPNWRK
jgi:phage terminase large subunit GpA-like protein